MSKASRLLKWENYFFDGQSTAYIFIALCRIIRKTNIEADTGLVWKSLCQSGGQTLDDRYFVLGIGINSAEPLFFYLPMERWEECYFAKELPACPLPTDIPPTLDQIRQSLSNLLG